jgi:uncharacterized damage-inducible protein DinB
MLSAQAVRLHLDYSDWASRRLLDAAAGLSAEELNQDFKTADKSVVGTLAHIFAADRTWLARLRGIPQTVFITDEDRNLTVLQTAWPALHQEWKDWAAALTDGQVQQDAAYHDLKGNPWKQPVWQIILHVVNHGTHHRGQVSGFIRTMGHKPPPLDLSAFYRGLTPC